MAAVEVRDGVGERVTRMSTARTRTPWASRSNVRPWREPGCSAIASICSIARLNISNWGAGSLDLDGVAEVGRQFEPGPAIARGGRESATSFSACTMA